MAEKKSYKIDRAKLIWVIGLSVTAILALVFVLRKKSGEVREVVVQINPLSDAESNFISEKDVKDIIKKAFEVKPDEAKVGQVDVARVEQILEQDPFIENAEVFMDANNDLDVKITQRQPICRIIDNFGSNYYLDKKGVKMPPSKHFSARVPVVTGAVPPHTPDFLDKKKYLLKDVFNLVQRIGEDPFFSPMVQQINVDAGGEFTLIPILGDQKIRLGTIDDLDEKLERLKVFYKEAMPYEGWRKYASISVKYKGQIVCKKR